MTRRINAAGDRYYVYRPMLDLIGFTDPKNMQHAVQILPIIVRGPRLPATFAGQKPLDDPPFHIRQVAASQNRLLKSSLESRFR